jgi:geranylgeranyl diphosphate synthase type I
VNKDNLTEVMLESIEEELRSAIGIIDQTGAWGSSLRVFRAMLAYHLGWEGEGAGLEARGKRIRPLLLLLTCASAGGEWQQALPAAAGVELVHNFSLIHDDIQDNSPYRRGRETVWKLWGIPQAINAGDAMLALAHLGIMRLEQSASPEVAFRAARILQLACLELTKGQHLDLAYEASQRLPLDEYWTMVTGKTAALLAACTELGALVAGIPDECRGHYRDFGLNLGLAFQAQDDLLGIWGDAALTGKSAESDLLAGKKSLPIVFGLNQEGDFARRWEQGPIRADEVPALARQLEAEGARAYVQECAAGMTKRALAALQETEPEGQAGELLVALATRLLNRSG